MKNNIADIENEITINQKEYGDKKKVIENSKRVFDNIVIDLAGKNLFSKLSLNWGHRRKNILGGSRYPNKDSQYAKAVFWYGFDFCNDGGNMRKDTMKDVKGIIIKPYCIYSSNVKDAVKKSDCHKFNEQDLDFVDIHEETFNIHKYPSLSAMRFQVVLVDNTLSQNGPGRVKSTESIDYFGKDTTLEEKLACVKTDWYFPAIQESVETCDISGCLTDSGKENILEEKPIKRLEYLLAVDIVKAMQAVLTDDSFNKYLANIKLEELCELESEFEPKTSTFFRELDARRKAITN